MHEDNSNEQAEQLTDALIQLPEMLPNILSVLFSRSIPTSSKETLDTSIDNMMQMVIEVVPKLSKFNVISNDPEQKRELFYLLDNTLRPYMKDIREDQSVFDFIIDFLDSRKPLPERSYLIETQYEEYMAVVSKLARDTVTLLPFNYYNRFIWAAFSSTEDILSIGQTVMTKFPNMNKEFSFQRKRFTKRQAERDIEYYHTLSGHFEKCIATVAGIIKSINGEDVTYTSMRRRRLASNLKTTRESEYSYLIDGFDKSIRNALAHQQWMVNPKKCTVSFYDPISAYTTEYSYRDINKKTKDLCASFISIYRLPILIWVETLSRFRDNIKNR